MKCSTHIQYQILRLIFCIAFLYSSLSAQPVITNAVYHPDDNNLALTFSEPILTSSVDFNLISFADANGQVALTGSEILNADTLVTELSVGLLVDGIIDSTTYGSNYGWYYLWGHNISLVRDVELMDLSDCSIIAEENAFTGLSGEPSANQTLLCEIQPATDLPVALSATYDAGTNLLSVTFSEPVQFDQIAEDQSCNGGAGNCPGNGQLDAGDNPEDRNDNGVLDMEPNINSERISFQDDTGNAFWLEGYREILQTTDSEQIDIKLTIADARRLEMNLNQATTNINLQPYAFLNTNYNPTLESEFPLQIVEDSQPLIAESATYDVGLNELEILFPNARNLMLYYTPPIYTNFHLSNSQDNISLSGIELASVSGSTLILRELTLSDQAALEELILNMPEENSLTLSVDPYSIFDVNGNGNLEIVDLSVDILGELNNPVLSSVSYHASTNRLTLDWSPDHVVYYQDDRLFETPETYSINGIIIHDMATDEILTLATADISRDNTMHYTYLELTNENAEFIESRANSGDNLSLTLEGYTFYSSGAINNNGNLWEEMDVYYQTDDSGPAITAVHLDKENHLLILNFDDNVLASSLDFSTVNLKITEVDITLTGLELVWESDMVTEARFSIPETGMAELSALIPQNEMIELQMYLSEGTAMNLDGSDSYGFLDLNGNGVWDDSPEPLDDFGTDGVPSELEEGYPGSCSISGACSDPGYDNQIDCENAGVCSDPLYVTEEDCMSNVGTCSIARWHTQSECEDHGGTWTPDPDAWGNAIWTELNTEELCVQYDAVWTPNLDPVGDDYDAITNPDGTEGNGILDLGETYQDIYPNGVWDNAEPIAVDVSFGRYLWNQSFRSYPEAPELMFSLQKYNDDNSTIYVEESAWDGRCHKGDEDAVIGPSSCTEVGVEYINGRCVFIDVKDETSCLAIPSVPNWAPVWTVVTSQAIIDVAEFYQNNKDGLMSTYGSVDSTISIVLYDISDEFGKGSNDTNSNLFTHGYFSNDEIGTDMTNTGEMIYLDVSPQYLYSGDGEIPDLGTMKNALVHEFTKMLITQNEPDEEVWLKEGLAFFEQKRILGETKFFGSGTDLNIHHSDQLTYIGFSKKNRWDQHNIYLFLQYLFEKFTQTNGWDFIDAIAQNQTAFGMESINEALLGLGYSQSIKDAFLDYATACFLDISQAYGYYDNRFTFDEVDLYGPPASRNITALKFDDNKPPPYNLDDIPPWSYGFYLIEGFSVSLLDNSLSLKSPLLASTDTLQFAGNHDVQYRMNKIMLRSGFTEAIDPLYEVVEMTIDPDFVLGAVPVTTNSVIVDSDTLNFTFRDYWGNCSHPAYDNQTDCEDSGNTWTWEGNMNAVLVVAKTDSDNSVSNPEYVISSSNEPILGAAPVNLQSTPLTNAVHLTWSPPPPIGNLIPQSYTILRASSQEETPLPIETGLNALMFEDTTASSGVIYSYAIAGEYGEGLLGTWSDTVQGWMLTETSFGFRTAITNYGSIGDPNSPSTGRPSCEYPYGSGNNYLYDAGLWIGANRYGAPSVTTYFYNPDQEWQPCVANGSIRPQKSFFILDSNNPVQEVCFDDYDAHSNSEHESLGIKVINRYELSPPVLNEDSGELEPAPWAKITYSIINSGMTGDLDELFVGLWMDLDVSSTDNDSPHIDDLVDYDADLKLSFMYDGDNPSSGDDDTGEYGLSSGYVGLVLLSSPNNNVASHAWWNWENDPGSDEELYEFMNASHPAMEGYQYYPNPLDLGYPPFDYRILQTTGPFSLNSYDTLKVEYLLVFGDDHEDLRQNVLTAMYLESQPLAGDLNLDEAVNILDIVILVTVIINGQPYIAEGDLNFDDANDILDVVMLVNIIMGESAYRRNPVSHAVVEKTDNTINLVADGPVAGIQLNVKGDFEILPDELPDGWKIEWSRNIILVYNMGTQTPLPERLFQFEGDLIISSVLVAGWNGRGIIADCDCLTPVEYALNPAYPNPFNPTTTISYSLPENGLVKIVVYDLRGREVIRLVDNVQNAGYYSVIWNADQISSGIYFIRMVSADFSKVNKVMILK